MKRDAYLQPVPEFNAPCPAFDQFDPDHMAHIIQDEGFRDAVLCVLTARYAVKQAQDSFGSLNHRKSCEALLKAADALHAYCDEQWRAGW